MNLLRKKLQQHPILKAMSSLKITVSCLCILFLLVWLGTVDQVDNGLYHAQESFFHSFFFLLFGVIPFPGAQLVLWILFFNLASVAVTRFVYRLSHIGILIIHFGLLTYFISAYVTLHVVEESHLTLREGQGSNISTSFRDWELSVWKEDQNRRKVVAYDAKNFQTGKSFDFPEYGLKVEVQQFYPNAEAYGAAGRSTAPILNSSGIQSLKEVEVAKEPEKNLPGGIFKISHDGEKDVSLLLYAGDPDSTVLSIGQQPLHFMLRHKSYPLPLTLTLKDFEMEVHPNTQIARSFKSHVSIATEHLTRELTIFMNNPLRFKNYTFYQASYAVDAMGRELSTLAVVKNSGRLLPYIASLTTFVGLVTHFLLAAFASGKRRRST